jgi:hypothetical protein
MADADRAANQKRLDDLRKSITENPSLPDPTPAPKIAPHKSPMTETQRALEIERRRREASALADRLAKPK